MRIFILTLGTRGDLELFLALGRELRGRGHQVVFGASEFYSARVRDAEVEWAQIGHGSRDELVSILRSLSSVRDKRKRTYLYASKWLRPQLSMAKSQIASLAEGVDYFISNLKVVLRRRADVVPGAAVTYDPPAAIEELSKYGTQEHNGSILDLVAMSKRLLDPRDRWGEQYRFTGFWRDERPQHCDPPEELVKFLDSGPPPVVITMGSMVMFDPTGFVRGVTAALRLAGQRGVIVGGWSGITHAGDTPDVHCIAEIAYDWLFPRASCVIHHGGTGTVDAVLRAGRPSIVVPQITCQEHFGEILVRENLAAGVFEADALDPHELAVAVRNAITHGRFQESARLWQEPISKERGVEVAADAIEAHWARLNGDEPD